MFRVPGEGYVQVLSLSSAMGHRHNGRCPAWSSEASGSDLTSVCGCPFYQGAYEGITWFEDFEIQTCYSDRLKYLETQELTLTLLIRRHAR